MGKIEWSKIKPVEGATLPYVPKPIAGPEFQTAQFWATIVSGGGAGVVAIGTPIFWAPNKPVMIRRIQYQVMCQPAPVPATGAFLIGGSIEIRSLATISINSGPLPGFLDAIPAIYTTPTYSIQWGFGPSQTVCDFPDGIYIPVVPQLQPLSIIMGAVRDGVFAAGDQLNFYLQFQYKDA